jgi:four helix bundle protein
LSIEFSEGNNEKRKMMAYATRFEDLTAWKKAREVNKAICQITRNDAFQQDYHSRSQIRRASLSIMSNIAEGFDRGNKGDFQRFLSIAKGSCAEVLCQLYAAFDDDYISESEFEQLIGIVVELGNIIGGLRNKVYKQWRATK